MKREHWILGIFGGLGLGLLLGSEFPGRMMTLLGAGFMIIFFIGMGVISYKKSKKGSKENE